MDTNFIGIEQYNHFSVGRIALTRSLITGSQILEALKMQHAEPSLKFGDILVQAGAITRYQLHEILSFQNAVLTKINRWKYIPDQILKGMVFFNQSQTFNLQQLKRAEQTAHQNFLDTNVLEPLCKVLIDNQAIDLNDFKVWKSSLQLAWYECSGCQRLFRLFWEKPTTEPIFCPSCWSVELTQKYDPQSISQVSLNLIAESLANPPTPPGNEIALEKITIPHQLPEFVLIYETLKRMEPDHRVGMTRKFSTDCRTIRLVFSNMANQFIEYEVKPTKEEPAPTASQPTATPAATTQPTAATAAVTTAEAAATLAQTAAVAAAEATSTLAQTAASNEPAGGTNFQYMGQAITMPEDKNKDKARILKKEKQDLLAPHNISKAVIRVNPNELAAKKAMRFFWGVIFGIIAIFAYILLVPSIFFSTGEDTNIQQQPPPTNTTPQPNPTKTPSPPPNLIPSSINPSTPTFTPTASSTSTASTTPGASIQPTRIPLDESAAAKIRTILPKVPKLGKMLEEDLQEMLKEPNWNLYQAKNASWLQLCQHHLFMKLPPEDGYYANHVMQNKVYKLYLLKDHIERTHQAFQTYMQAQKAKLAEKKGKLTEKSLHELAQNAQATELIQNCRILVSEISDNKVTIFDGFVSGE